MVNKAGSILGLQVFTFNGISSTFSLLSCCKEGRKEGLVAQSCLTLWDPWTIAHSISSTMSSFPKL